MNMTRLESLADTLTAVFSDRITKPVREYDELTIVSSVEEVLEVCRILRDHESLSFDTLIDLCGVDYLTYDGDDASLEANNEKRFAVVYHLLSVSLNQRLRLKVYAEDKEFPVVASVMKIWPAANWFEREAFDLYGIVFPGHSDLRRLLTDYGFVGNPFRKDFPISGYVEMRYDEEQKRVIYQPVSIEPREIVPLVIREQNYGDSHED